MRTTKSDRYFNPVSDPTVVKELIIPLPSGNTLRCQEGQDYMWGAGVRICDATGQELLCWDSSEWEVEGEGEAVMGAIFAAALSDEVRIRDHTP